MLCVSNVHISVSCENPNTTNATSSAQKRPTNLHWYSLIASNNLSQTLHRPLQNPLFKVDAVRLQHNVEFKAKDEIDLKTKYNSLKSFFNGVFFLSYSSPFGNRSRQQSSAGSNHYEMKPYSPSGESASSCYTNCKLNFSIIINLYSFFYVKFLVSFHYFQFFFPNNSFIIYNKSTFNYLVFFSILLINIIFLRLVIFPFPLSSTARTMTSRSSECSSSQLAELVTSSPTTPSKVDVAVTLPSGHIDTSYRDRICLTIVKQVSIERALLSLELGCINLFLFIN